jgi:geranylgeranyl reductase family protein
VLERQVVPRYKTCGGGVVARALSYLPDGISVEPDRLCRVVELNFIADGPRFLVERSEPIVATTMRADFDRTLLDAARDAGAEIRQACEFRAVVERNGGLEVETCQGTLKAGFLIGADGANGNVARRAGWLRTPVCIPALEAELRVDDATFERFAATLRFDLGLPTDGYGWVFPKRRHLSVGLLRMRRGRGGLKRLLGQYLERVGLTPTDEMELHGALIPVSPRPGGAMRGRVMLVGDAAGLADPVTGEGISHAIRSGQLAAGAIVEGELQPAQVGRVYRADLGREILSELRAGRLLARMLYGLPRLRRAVIRRVGRRLGNALTEVVLGRRSYRELIRNPVNYFKLFRRDRAA